MAKVNLTKMLLLSKINDFIDEEIMDEKASATHIKYKNVVTQFVGHFENEAIAKSDLIDYKKWLMEKYSVKTVNNYIIIVNKFIKYVELTEKGKYSRKKMKKYVSKNSLKTVKEQEKTSIEDVLDPVDFKRMLRMAKKLGQEDTYYIMKIFGYTGIRVSELKYFTIENLTQNKQYIQVFNKAKMRQVPIRGDLRRELLAYAKKKGIEEGTLFPGAKSGKMITQKTVENRIKKICRECRGIKIEKAHPHSFRHMFGIQWVSQNGQASLSELAKIMGHSNVNTTAIYTNTTQKEKKRKVEALKY
ncbi:site-specific integrase [[Clostridium] spiroforme]|nr:site-specific integrase [Thomasclavelia spiroformis]